MQYYMDLFDMKIDTAHQRSFDRDLDFFTSISPRALNYDYPECDPLESSDFRFCQNQKFGQPRL